MTAVTDGGRARKDVQAPWQQMIPVDRLHPGPGNPRKDPGDLKGLAATLREDGLLQVLVVRPAPDIGPGHYYIVDGWRRYLAMKDWRTEIRCDVRPALASGVTAVQDVITALVTDVHKKNLNAMERAEGLGELAKLGMTEVAISQATGLHVTTVSNGLALLEFSAADREKIRSGELPVTEALKIVRRYRRRQNKKLGRGQRDPHWEPDHFTVKHPLARIAKVMCDAREHTSRRRRGGACDHCWEDAIRADQRKIDEASFAARDRFAAAMGAREQNGTAGVTA
jgi:ParB/RepB/Spo0J family partition protein